MVRKSNPALFWFLLGTFFALILISAILLWRQLDTRRPMVLGESYRPATLELTVPPIIDINSTFGVEMAIDTSGQPANAVGLYARFDPKMLAVSSMDTSQSFCQFYPENRYNNDAGTISLACGAPNPGFTGKNTIVKLNFVAKQQGQTVIQFDSKKTQVLLNNGKGTNIYTGPYDFPITIMNTL